LVGAPVYSHFAYLGIAPLVHAERPYCPALLLTHTDTWVLVRIASVWLVAADVPVAVDTAAAVELLLVGSGAGLGAKRVCFALAPVVTQMSFSVQELAAVQVPAVAQGLGAESAEQ